MTNPIPDLAALRRYAASAKLAYSRHGYENMLSVLNFAHEAMDDVPALCDALEAAQQRAKEWCELSMSTLNELRHNLAPGTTKDTDGPILAHDLREERDRLKKQVEAMREAAEHLLFIQDNKLSIEAKITNGMIDDAWMAFRAALAANKETE